MKRLCLLGLDAGDLPFIQSRIAALPCFQTLLHSGKALTLQAPKALSGSVWPTFYNGASPGVHGLYQHLVWDASRMGIRRIGPDWCYYRPFWQDLEEAGHRAIVLDVPYSFPVALTKGIEITDWGTHGQTFPLSCNQQTLQPLLKQIGKSPIGRETPIQKSHNELQRIQHQLVQSAALKGRLISELANLPDWELLLAVFGETHRAGHIFFSEEDEKAYDGPTPLLEIYQAVDRALGDILHLVGDDTSVMIFSVHGMARDSAQGHLVRPLMKRINEEFLRTYCRLSPKRAWKAAGLIPYLRKAVPSRLQYAIGASSPDAVRQWVVEKEITGGLDWAETPAFALRTDIRTELRLNLVGRESQGFLEPDSDRLRTYVDFLKRVFLELHDQETGAPLIEEIVDTQQIFPGPRHSSLPDLVLTWHPRPFAQKVFSPLIGELESPQRPAARGGDHTDEGFAILPESLADLHPLQHITDIAGWSRKFMATAS